MTAENELGLIPESSVAEMFGFSLAQWRRKIKGGLGPDSVKIGQARFYTRGDIETWLKSRRVPGKRDVTKETANAEA